MRITANLHFSEFKAEFYEADDKHKSFACIEMDGEKSAIDSASIWLHSEEEADALIKAACAAKDMLHAAAHAAVMTEPGTYHSPFTATSAAEVAEGVLEAGEAGHPTGNIVADPSPFTGREAYCLQCGVKVGDDGSHTTPGGLHVSAEDTAHHLGMRAVTR